MTINIGGQQFTENEVIAAIAASNDAAPTENPLEAVTIEDVRNILQALLTRVKALENTAPISRSGYGVTTTKTNNITTHRVQMLDHLGQTVFVTFEVPST